MTEPRFQPLPTALDLAAILALTGARAAEPAAGRTLAITGIGSLDWACPSDIACLENVGGLAALGATDAGACIVPPEAERDVPASSVAIVAERPGEAFVAVAAALFPSAARPVALFGPGIAAGAAVHPEARLEPDVSVDPGAVIGPGAEIGRGAVIGANAVIGAGVRIGRESRIGAGATVVDALIGDRVIVQPGASLGHSGLGERSNGLDLGRVVIQDDVRIGANAAVARGRARDTIIGEGSRIDALARIAPDVVIGRHCLVYSLVPLDRGVTIEDHSICGLDDDRRAAAERLRR